MDPQLHGLSLARQGGPSTWPLARSGHCSCAIPSSFKIYMFGGYNHGDEGDVEYEGADFGSLWSFHLLCAAILMSVRYTNRQIKHTACGHAWESIPWRGAWWGALPLAWSCASLPPRFVAGLGDDVAAVRPMRVNPVCCGAWTCEVREVDLARWFSWGVHVIKKCGNDE